MVYLCKNNQEEIILSYIGKDYPKCLYLYIDLQKYGCTSLVTKTWMHLVNGDIKAVLLSYHSALHIYSKDLDFDAEEISHFVVEQNPSIVCASAGLIRLLEPLLLSNGFISEYGYVGKYCGDAMPTLSFDVLKAKKSDIWQIAQLLYRDEDIGASYSLDDLVKQIQERFNDNYVRSYVIKDDDSVVAHLGTGAEIAGLCTISYVITAQDYRGKGMSSALFAHACRELKQEGKEIFSVYYPENSRRIHHKMGFVDSCEIGKLFRTIE